MKRENVLLILAREQFGLVTRAQALESGMSASTIARRLAAGRWEVVHHGVYRIAGSPPSTEQRVTAACLAAGPKAAVSHRAAAELWQLDGPDRGYSEIVRPRPCSTRISGVVVHQVRDLLDHHVTRVNRIPVTTPMRTILDLGAVCARREVERSLDDALGRKLVTIPGMVRVWRECGRPGRNGSGVLRGLLEEHLPNPHGTVLEKKMLRLHRRHGLPEPHVEFVIRDPAGRFIGRVDFAHPRARLAIEVDGFHKRTSLDAFQRDRVRARDLLRVGWDVIRFTWLEMHFTPELVAKEIGEFLRQP